MGMARTVAKEFLRERLSAQTGPAAAIDVAAAAAGISKRTLRRAKVELQVVSEKTRDGWWWRLSEPADENASTLEAIKASDVELGGRIPPLVEKEK
jgi:hypothetical protein